MLYPKSPKRSDKFLNYDMIKNLFDNVKKGMQLRFDPNYFYTTQDSSGMYIALRPGGKNTEDPTKWSFGVTLTSTQAHIEQGWFMIQGEKYYYYEGGDVDLPTNASDGDYCYPTINYSVSGKAIAAVCLSDFPTMTKTDVNVPLVELTFTKLDEGDGSWGFVDKGYILHRGNINFSSPIVFG